MDSDEDLAISLIRGGVEGSSSLQQAAAASSKRKPKNREIQKVKLEKRTSILTSGTNGEKIHLLCSTLRAAKLDMSEEQGLRAASEKQQMLLRSAAFRCLFDETNMLTKSSTKEVAELSLLLFESSLRSLDATISSNDITNFAFVIRDTWESFMACMSCLGHPPGKLGERAQDELPSMDSAPSGGEEEQSSYSDAFEEEVFYIVGKYTGTIYRAVGASCSFHVELGGTLAGEMMSVVTDREPRWANLPNVYETTAPIVNENTGIADELFVKLKSMFILLEILQVSKRARSKPTQMKQLQVRLDELENSFSGNVSNSFSIGDTERVIVEVGEFFNYMYNVLDQEMIGYSDSCVWDTWKQWAIIRAKLTLCLCTTSSHILKRYGCHEERCFALASNGLYLKNEISLVNEAAMFLKLVHRGLTHIQDNSDNMASQSTRLGSFLDELSKGNKNQSQPTMQILIGKVLELVIRSWDTDLGNCSVPMNSNHLLKLNLQCQDAKESRLEETPAIIQDSKFGTLELCKLGLQVFSSLISIGEHLPSGGRENKLLLAIVQRAVRPSKRLMPVADMMVDAVSAWCGTAKRSSAVQTEFHWDAAALLLQEPDLGIDSLSWRFDLRAPEVKMLRLVLTCAFRKPSTKLHERNYFMQVSSLPSQGTVLSECSNALHEGFGTEGLGHDRAKTEGGGEENLDVTDIGRSYIRKASSTPERNASPTFPRTSFDPLVATLWRGLVTSVWVQLQSGGGDLTAEKLQESINLMLPFVHHIGHQVAISILDTLFEIVRLVHALCNPLIQKCLSQILSLIGQLVSGWLDDRNTIASGPERCYGTPHPQFAASCPKDLVLEWSKSLRSCIAAKFDLVNLKSGADQDSMKMRLSNAGLVVQCVQLLMALPLDTVQQDTGAFGLFPLIGLCTRAIARLVRDRKSADDEQLPSEKSAGPSLVDLLDVLTSLLKSSRTALWEILDCPTARIPSPVLLDARGIVCTVHCQMTLWSTVLGHIASGSLTKLKEGGDGKALFAEKGEDIVPLFRDITLGLAALIERTAISMLTPESRDLSNDEITKLRLLFSSQLDIRQVYEFFVNVLGIESESAEACARATVFCCPSGGVELPTEAEQKLRVTTDTQYYDMVSSLKMDKMKSNSPTSLQVVFAQAKAASKAFIREPESKMLEFSGKQTTAMESVVEQLTIALNELVSADLESEQSTMVAMNSSVLLCSKQALQTAVTASHVFVEMCMDGDEARKVLKKCDLDQVFDLVSFNGLTSSIGQQENIRIRFPHSLVQDGALARYGDVCEVNHLSLVVEVLGQQLVSSEMTKESLGLLRSCIHELLEVIHSNPRLIMSMESGSLTKSTFLKSASESMSLSLLELSIPSSIVARKTKASSKPSGSSNRKSILSLFGSEPSSTGPHSPLKRPHQSLLQVIIHACYGIRKLAQLPATVPASGVAVVRTENQSSLEQQKALGEVTDLCNAYLVVLLAKATGGQVPSSVPAEIRLKLDAAGPSSQGKPATGEASSLVCENVCASFEMLMMNGSDINVYIQALLLGVYSARSPLAASRPLEPPPAAPLHHQLAYDVLDQLVLASRWAERQGPGGGSEAFASWEKALLQAMLRVDPGLLTREPSALPKYYALLGSVARPQRQVEQLIFLAMGVMDCVIDHCSRAPEGGEELNWIVAGKVSLCCIDCTLTMLQGLPLVENAEHKEDPSDSSSDESLQGAEREAPAKARETPRSLGASARRNRGGSSSLFDFANLDDSGMGAVLGRMLRRHVNLSRTQSDDSGGSNVLVLEPGSYLPQRAFTVLEEASNDAGEAGSGDPADDLEEEEDMDLEGDEEFEEQILEEDNGDVSVEESVSGIASGDGAFQVGSRVRWLNPHVDEYVNGMVLNVTNEGESLMYDLELEHGAVVAMVSGDQLKPIVPKRTVKVSLQSKRKQKEQSDDDDDDDDDGDDDDDDDDDENSNDSDSNKEKEGDEGADSTELATKQSQTSNENNHARTGSGQFSAMMSAAFTGEQSVGLKGSTNNDRQSRGLGNGASNDPFLDTLVSDRGRLVTKQGKPSNRLSSNAHLSIGDLYELFLGKLGGRLETVIRSRDTSSGSMFEMSNNGSRSGSAALSKLFKLNRPTEPQLCSYTRTGRNYQEQHWYHCIDCGLVADKGCCTVCARVCHAGHDIVYARKSRFFCDCGESEPATPAASGGGDASANASKRSSKESKKGTQHVCKARQPGNVGAVNRAHRSPLSMKPMNSSNTPSSKRKKRLKESFAKNNGSVAEQNTRKAVLDFLQAAGLLERMLTAYKWANSLYLSTRNNTVRPCAVQQLENANGNPSKDSTDVEMRQVVPSTAASKRASSILNQRPFQIDQTLFSLWTSFEPKSTGGISGQSTSSMSGDDGRSDRMDPEVAVLLRERVLCSASYKQGMAITPTGQVCVADLSVLRVYSVGPLLDNRPFQTTLSHNCTVELGNKCMGFVISSLELNACNPKLLAVVGLHECTIATLGGNGEIEETLNLNLDLSNDDSLYAIRALWVPSSPSRLVLVTNRFVRVFDFAVDTLCPLRTCTLRDSSQVIVDTAFVPVALREEAGLQDLVHGVLLVLCRSGSVYRMPLAGSQPAESRLAAAPGPLAQEAARILQQEKVGSVFRLPGHAPCEANPKVGPNGRLTAAVSIFFAAHQQRLVLSYDDKTTISCALDPLASEARDAISLSLDASNIMVTLELRKQRMNAPCVAWAEWPDAHPATASGTLIGFTSRPGERDGMLLALRVQADLVKAQSLFPEVQRKSSAAGISPPPPAGTGQLEAPRQLGVPARGYAVWNPRPAVDCVPEAALGAVAPALLVLYEDGSIAKYCATAPPAGEEEGGDVSTASAVPAQGDAALKEAGLEAEPGKSQESPVERLLRGGHIVNESGRELTALVAAANNAPGPFAFEEFVPITEHQNPALYSSLSFSGHLVLKQTAKAVKGNLRSIAHDSFVTGYHRRSLSVDVHLSDPAHCIAAVRVQVGTNDGKQVPQSVKVGAQNRTIPFTSGVSRWYDVALTPREVHRANRDRFVHLTFDATFDGEAQCIQSIEVYALAVMGQSWKELMRPVYLLGELLQRDLPSPLQGHKLLGLTGAMEFSVSILARYLQLATAANGPQPSQEAAGPGEAPGGRSSALKEMLAPDETVKLDSCVWDILSSTPREIFADVSLNPEQRCLRHIAQKVTKTISESPAVAQQREDFAALHGTWELLGGEEGGERGPLSQANARRFWESVVFLSVVVAQRPLNVLRWLRGRGGFAKDVAEAFLQDWRSHRIMQACFTHNTAFKAVNTIVYLMTFAAVFAYVDEPAEKASGIGGDLAELCVRLLEHPFRLVRMSASCSLEMAMFVTVNLPLSSIGDAKLPLEKLWQGSVLTKLKDSLGQAVRSLQSDDKELAGENSAAAALVAAASGSPNLSSQKSNIKYRCDCCATFPLTERWVCTTCEDYDLCPTCYSRKKHAHHVMVKRNNHVNSSEQTKPEVPKPNPAEQKKNTASETLGIDQVALGGLSKFAAVLVDKVMSALESNNGKRSCAVDLPEYLSLLQTLGRVSMPLLRPNVKELEPLRQAWVVASMPRFWKLLLTLMDESTDYIKSLSSKSRNNSVANVEPVPPASQRLLLLLQILNRWAEQVPSRTQGVSSNRDSQESRQKESLSRTATGSMAARRVNSGECLMLDKASHQGLSNRILSMLKTWCSNIDNFSETVTHSLSIAESWSAKKTESPFEPTSKMEKSTHMEVAVDETEFAMIEMLPHFPVASVYATEGNQASLFSGRRFAAALATAVLETACTVIPSCPSKVRQKLFTEWESWLLSIVNACRAKHLCSTAKYTLLALSATKQQYRNARTQSLLDHEFKQIRKYLTAPAPCEGPVRVMDKYQQSVELLQALHRASQASSKYTPQWQAFLASPQGADVLGLLFDALPELPPPTQTGILKLLRDAVGSSSSGSTIGGQNRTKALKQSNIEQNLTAKRHILAQFFQQTGIGRGLFKPRIVLLLDDFVIGSEHPEHRQLACHTMLRLWANCRLQERIHVLKLLLDRLSMINSPGVQSFLSVLCFAVKHATSDAAGHKAQDPAQRELEDVLDAVTEKFSSEFTRALETLDLSSHAMTMRNLSKLVQVLDASWSAGGATAGKDQPEPPAAGAKPSSDQGCENANPETLERIRTVLSKLRAVAGGQACLLCHVKPPFLPKPLPLEKVRKSVAWSSNSMVVQLDALYRLQSIQVDVSRSSAHASCLRAIAVYHADSGSLRSASHTRDLDALKNDWSSWQLLGKLEVGSDPGARLLRLQVPLTTRLLRIEYVTAAEEGASGKTERLQCPRCSRVVTDKHGVCRHCGEVVFQCRQCRNINYEDLQAFLCVECGYCRFARFIVRVEGQRATGYPRVTDDQGRLGAMQYLRVLSNKRADKLEALRQALAPMDRLGTQLWRGMAEAKKFVQTKPAPPAAASKRKAVAGKAQASSPPQSMTEERLRERIAQFHRHRQGRTGRKEPRDARRGAIKFAPAANRKFGRALGENASSASKDSIDGIVRNLESATNAAFALHQDACEIAVQMKAVHQQIVLFECSGARAASPTDEASDGTGQATVSGQVKDLVDTCRPCARCAECVLNFGEQLLEALVARQRSRRVVVDAGVVEALAHRAGPLGADWLDLGRQGALERGTVSLVSICRFNLNALKRFVRVVKQHVQAALQSPYTLQGADWVGNSVKVLCYMVVLGCLEPTKFVNNVVSSGEVDKCAQFALNSLISHLGMLSTKTEIHPELMTSLVHPVLCTMVKIVEHGLQSSGEEWYVRRIALAVVCFIRKLPQANRRPRVRAAMHSVLLGQGTGDVVRKFPELEWTLAYQDLASNAASRLSRFWRTKSSALCAVNNEKSVPERAPSDSDYHLGQRHWVHHIILESDSSMILEEMCTLLVLLGAPAAVEIVSEEKGKAKKDEENKGVERSKLATDDIAMTVASGSEKDACAEDGKAQGSQLGLVSLGILDVMMDMVGKGLESRNADAVVCACEVLHELLDRCGELGSEYLASRGAVHFLVTLLSQQCCTLLGIEYCTVGEGRSTTVGQWVTDSEQGSYATTSAVCRIAQLLFTLCQSSPVTRLISYQFQVTVLECFVALKSLRVLADNELEMATKSLDSILQCIRTSNFARDRPTATQQGTMEDETKTASRKRKNNKIDETTVADGGAATKGEERNGKRAFMTAGASLLNKLSCKLVQLLETSTAASHAQDNLEGFSNQEMYFRITPRSLFSMVRSLVDELISVACPTKELPPIFILLQRATSQEEYFRGSLPKNPISIADVNVTESTDANANNGQSTRPSASPALGPSNRTAASPAPGGGTGVIGSDQHGGKEPTIRDLRAKIAADLNFRDATEIMELLVAGKIMGLDLPISMVFEKVWKPHLLEESNLESEHDAEEESGQSEEDDEQSEIDFLHSEMVDLENQVPPMEVTYRLCGVDGEATEDFVESLDSPAADDKEKDIAEEFEVMTTFASTLPGATGSGMTALLGIIQVATSSNYATSIPSDQLRGLLQAALSLFLHCCRVKENREVLLQWDAVPLLLDALMALFRHNKAARQAEQLLLILEQLVGEANAQGHGLGAIPGAQTLPLALALEPKGPKRPKTEGGEWPEHVKEEAGASGDKSAPQGPDADLAMGDNSHLIWFLDQLDGHHKSQTLSDNPQLVRAMARLLPYMTYGRPFAIHSLLARFAKVVGKDALRALDAGADREAACAAANDVRTALGQILVASEGIALDESGYKLREAALLSGLVPSFVGHLVASATGAEEAKDGLKDSAQRVASVVALGGGSTKRKSWLKFASLPSLPIVLRLLAGFAKDHGKVQELIASSGGLRIVFELERVPDSIVSDVGELADQLLIVLRSGTSNVRNEITKLEHERREAKRKLAMKQRQQTLRKMGLKVVQSAKGKRKAAPVDSGQDTGGSQLGSGVQIVSAVTSEEQNAGKRPRTCSDNASGTKKRKKKKNKGKSKLKGKATQNFSWMEEIATLEEEKGVVCTVCQEGYSYKPSEPVGVYVYSRSLVLPRGAAIVDVDGALYPPAVVVDSAEEASGTTSQNTTTESSPNKSADSKSGFRSIWGVTTVTSLNCIHLSCHKNAVVADKNHPKAPKGEWEGAELRNTQAKCNNLLPFRGPSESITKSAYSGALEHYFATQQQHARLPNTPSHRPSAFALVVHDIRVLLLRLVYKESFSDDTNGGGQESNIKLLVPLMEAARHLFVDADLWCPAQRGKSHSAPGLADHAYLYGSGSRLFPGGSPAAGASSPAEGAKPPTPKRVNETLLHGLQQFYKQFESASSTMTCFVNASESTALRDVEFFALVSVFLCDWAEWEANKARFVRAAIGLAWWKLDRVRRGELPATLFGSGANLPRRRARTMSTDSGVPLRHFSFDDRAGWPPGLASPSTEVRGRTEADEVASSAAALESNIQGVLVTTCLPVIKYLCLVHELHRVSHSKQGQVPGSSGGAQVPGGAKEPLGDLASRNSLEKLQVFLSDERSAMDVCDSVLEVYQNTVATCETIQDLVQFIGVENSVAVEMVDHIYEFEKEVKN